MGDECCGGGCMTLEDEVKRMNDRAVRLTEIIKARESRINELTNEMEEVNANFAAIRESNERLRQERAALTDRVAELSRQVVDLERQVKDGQTDVRYWLDQYQSEQTKASAYLNVIKILSGRE